MLMKENEKLLTSPMPDFPYFPSAASNGFGTVLQSGSLRYGDWTAWQSCSTSCGLGGPGGVVVGGAGDGGCGFIIGC